MILIRRSQTISCAHFLPGHERCGAMHGHNYRITVGLSCKDNELEDGMLLDFGDLAEMMKTVLEKYDHHLLNDYLSPPTAENFAVQLAGELQAFDPRLAKLVYELMVEETDACSASFYPVQQVSD
jgi:6-pyruvoyltetrahydropterin/6-carboxytetrahydropterin synthase